MSKWQEVRNEWEFLIINLGIMYTDKSQLFQHFLLTSCITTIIVPCEAKRNPDEIGTAHLRF